MGKVWILDTDTKGTGARMVPLERALERKRSAATGERISVLRRRPAPPDEETAQPDQPPKSRPPLRFKVVNAITGQAVGEGIGLREAVDLLDGIRSLVDVRIYLWEPGPAEWRPLTLGEQRAMWRLR
jgi:hypothetical protein